MAQGHWRRLDPEEVGEGRFGEKTYGKTWVDREDTTGASSAKKVRSVLPPTIVRIDKDAGFAVLAVPGGRVLFTIHLSVLEDFGKAVAASENWTTDKKVREIMQSAEREGKFGIFQTSKQVVDY